MSGSLGWLTESTIIPKPGERIEGISDKTSLLIKSALDATDGLTGSTFPQEGFNATKLTLSTGRKEKEISNEGLMKRKLRDEKDNIKESLSIKARFYNKLSSTKSKGNKTFLINFDEKTKNDQLNQAENVHRGKSIYHLNNEEEEIDLTHLNKKDSLNDNSETDSSLEEEHIHKEEEETIAEIRRQNRKLNDFKNIKNVQNEIKMTKNAEVENIFKQKRPEKHDKINGLVKEDLSGFEKFWKLIENEKSLKNAQKEKLLKERNFRREIALKLIEEDGNPLEH